MNYSDPFSMSNYVIYRFRWYVIKYVDCKTYPTMECCIWPKMIKKNQDDILGKVLPVISSKVHNLLQNNHTYVWYQDYISLDEHTLVEPFQFETTGRNKLK